MSSTIKALIGVGFSLGLVIGLQTVGLGQQKAQAQGKPSAALLTPIDAARFVLNGRSLAAQDAANLEESLEQNPGDLATRITLVGYYSAQNARDESVRLKRRGHALWFIQNCPDSKLLQSFIHLFKSQDSEGYDEAKQLWLKQIEAFKNNPVVLSNALNFFLVNDNALAEQLLRQGAAVEPTEPQWHSSLGHLYAMEMHYAEDATKRTLAPLSYEQYTQALKLTTNEQLKFYLLADVAKSALEAGEVTAAETWAAELLNRAATRQKDWYYCQAINQGHLVLGRIALRSGNRAEAVRQLLEAGKISGRSSSFGPNMMLAKELLEKGERDAVIQYLQLCEGFWTDHAKLQEWTATVRAGGIPNFGANLFY